MLYGVGKSEYHQSAHNSHGWPEIFVWKKGGFEYQSIIIELGAHWMNNWHLPETVYNNIINRGHWLEKWVIGLVEPAKSGERGSVVRWSLAWLSKRIILSDNWRSMSNSGSPGRKVRSPEFVCFWFSVFSGGARLVMMIRGIEVCQWNLSHID